MPSSHFGERQKLAEEEAKFENDIHELKLKYKLKKRMPREGNASSVSQRLDRSENVSLKDLEILSEDMRNDASRKTMLDTENQQQNSSSALVKRRSLLAQSGQSNYRDIFTPTSKKSRVTFDLRGTKQSRSTLRDTGPRVYDAYRRHARLLAA